MEAGSSEVVPVMYDSAVHEDVCCRSSSVGSLPKPRPQSNDSIVDCRCPFDTQAADSGSPFGSQLVLGAIVVNFAAEAAREGYVSLCMSQWSASGGKTTSRHSFAKTRTDRAFLHRPPDALRGRLRNRRYTFSR